MCIKTCCIWTVCAHTSVETHECDAAQQEGKADDTKKKKKKTIIKTSVSSLIRYLAYIPSRNRPSSPSSSCQVTESVQTQHGFCDSCARHFSSLGMSMRETILKYWAYKNEKRLTRAVSPDNIPLNALLATPTDHHGDGASGGGGGRRHELQALYHAYAYHSKGCKDAPTMGRFRDNPVGFLDQLREETLAMASWPRDEPRHRPSSFYSEKTGRRNPIAAILEKDDYEDSELSDFLPIQVPSPSPRAAKSFPGIHVDTLHKLEGRDSWSYLDVEDDEDFGLADDLSEYGAALRGGEETGSAFPSPATSGTTGWESDYRMGDRFFPSPSGAIHNNLEVDIRSPTIDIRSPTVDIRSPTLINTPSMDNYDNVELCFKVEMRTDGDAHFVLVNDDDDNENENENDNISTQQLPSWQCRSSLRHYAHRVANVPLPPPPRTAHSGLLRRLGLENAVPPGCFCDEEEEEEEEDDDNCKAGAGTRTWIGKCEPCKYREAARNQKALPF